LAGSQLQLAADQVQLGGLCVIEVIGGGPVAAGIDHSFAQHGAKQVVAQIVMHFCHLEGVFTTLQVDETGLQVGEQGVEGFQLLVKSGGQQAGAQSRQERAVSEDTRIKPFIMHAQVDRRVAVDVDASMLQQFAGTFLEGLLTHRVSSSVK
jgi:hypothetical protein